MVTVPSPHAGRTYMRRNRCPPVVGAAALKILTCFFVYARIDIPVLFWSCGNVCSHYRMHATGAPMMADDTPTVNTPPRPPARYPETYQYELDPTKIERFLQVHASGIDRLYCNGVLSPRAW